MDGVACAGLLMCCACLSGILEVGTPNHLTPLLLAQIHLLIPITTSISDALVQSGMGAALASVMPTDDVTLSLSRQPGASVTA